MFTRTSNVYHNNLTGWLYIDNSLGSYFISYVSKITSKRRLYIFSNSTRKLKYESIFDIILVLSYFAGQASEYCTANVSKHYLFVVRIMSCARTNAMSALSVDLSGRRCFTLTIVLSGCNLSVVVARRRTRYVPPAPLRNVSRVTVAPRRLA